LLYTLNVKKPLKGYRSKLHIAKTINFCCLVNTIMFRFIVHMRYVPKAKTTAIVGLFLLPVLFLITILHLWTTVKHRSTFQQHRPICNNDSTNFKHGHRPQYWIITFVCRPPERVLSWSENAPKIWQ